MLLLLTAALLGAPDVILISVDTLRADRLGCYGYDRNTSPNLDAFAAESLLFEDCVCEVPLTSPSFGAMMTSRFPRMNGATRNGVPLPEAVATVAERFRDAGYQTVCVQSNWTLKSKLSGLDRGFETYDDRFHKKRWGFIKSERYGDEVTRLSVEALDARDPERPLFAWFHYSDPHAPYRFHKKLNPAGKPLRKFDEVEKVHARYDSEVAYTDAQIGELLRAISTENTFVVFVGDHGESLYEHDYLGHGRRIFQAGLHIPLIVRGPGIAVGRSDAPVRGIDVGTTLLGLAGIERAPGMLGADLSVATVGADRVRVVETYGGAVPKLPGARALMADRAPMRQGVLLHEWKLILHGKRPALYNLIEDPGEENDVADGEPERVAELRALIEAWDEATRIESVESADLNEEDLEALDALGYVE